MAIMKGMKRGRPSTSPMRAAMKRAKAGKNPNAAVAEKCRLVVAAVKQAGDLTAAVKDMLVKAVPTSLGEFADARHHVQVQVVKWVGDALSGVETGLKKGRDEAQANLESKSHAATEKAAALASLTSASAEAVKAFKAAESAQRTVESELAAAKAGKAALEDSKANDFLPMKERAGSAAEVKRILALGGKYHCEMAFLTMLPAVLKKEPTARGTFDQLAMTQLEDWYEKTTAGHVDTLQAADASSATAAAELEAAAAAKTAAAERTHEASAAHAEAQQAQKKAAAAPKAAEKAVEAFEWEKEEAVRAFCDATKKLDNFASGALAAYQELAAHTTPPPKNLEDLDAGVSVEKATKLADTQ
jgi:hypothetical protein